MAELHPLHEPYAQGLLDVGHSPGSRRYFDPRRHHESGHTGSPWMGEAVLAAIERFA
ncbi:hypothetical protein ACFRAR_19530 [Kitasatospora sp. NPDC056651]|uniref:hypothetical protein n=1 Tax=Kitasatospora sp. NPDC056651 TaxID=3345892 RepID=UPI0036C583DD